MRFVELEGERISVVGLGCWQFGSREWGYGADYANSTAEALVRRALDLGINLIDTAELYAFGRSEQIVGRALAGRRDEAFIATKLLPVVPLAPVVEQRARASAKRLGVTTIDLYQIHWPNPVVPLSTTMDGMRRLVDEGLVRHAGVSNFSLDRWRRAEREMAGPVLSNQVRFNLVDRAPLRYLVPYAAEAGRLVIAYSPLAQGLLGGRYDADNLPAGTARMGNLLFVPENLRRAGGLISTLREVASGHDATPAQVALAWLIRRPNVVVIPGASSLEQLERNAAAADIELTDDEDAALLAAAEAFRPERGPRAMVQAVRARLPV
jgi:aryl-alcohol dehydrogenase-like predicted oxidoreductase